VGNYHHSQELRTRRRATSCSQLKLIGSIATAWLPHGLLWNTTCEYWLQRSLASARAGEFLVRVGHRGSCDEAYRDLDGGFHALTGAMIFVGSISLLFEMGSTLDENGDILGCRQDGSQSTREDRIPRKEITGGIGELTVYVE